ncbi:hypothetical protein K7X08_023799 [Anisodus acutangulus]|uniref:Uncharacterized protein n=1 Tax=Anisodus acutangulus TaxID=402998 RepID=A0A9Q1L7G2_9SOLA|nr:hypothetical protein K7X08_023799 [Anisodus acutangulus]
MGIGSALSPAMSARQTTKSSMMSNGANHQLQMSTSMGVSTAVKTDSTTGETVPQVIEVTPAGAGVEEVENRDTTTAPWVNLFKKNWAAENGLSLLYIPPQIIDGKVVVQLEEEVDRETEKWRS